MNYKDYIKWDRMPTTWCPGCAIGTIFKQTAFALAEIGLAAEEMTVVSGIGCSGRAAGYFNVDSVHVTHGRALPVAEGIKRANPKLKVIVFSGDGDLVGIGGNHLLHAARRDVDLAVICVNNAIYGMTGGQMAPTTPTGEKTLTSPHGSLLRAPQHPGDRHQQPASLVRPGLDVPRRPSPEGHPGGRRKTGFRLRRSHGLLHRKQRPEARLQVRPRYAHPAEKRLQAQGRPGRPSRRSFELGVVKNDGQSG